MKKLWVVLAPCLICGMVQTAKAQSADTFLQKAWSGISAKENFHFFDNGTAAYYNDCVNREELAGVSTMLYKKSFISADVGMASSKVDAHVIFPVGFMAHAGEYLGTLTAVKSVTTAVGLNQGALKYLNIGAWGTRDFYAHVWRAGYWAGFQVKF